MTSLTDEIRTALTTARYTTDSVNVIMAALDPILSRASPAVSPREIIELNQQALEWREKAEHGFRCFHCRFWFFADDWTAQEHFGEAASDTPACVTAALLAARSGKHEAEAALADLKARIHQLAASLVPFHPGAYRDPEGIWWDCDWCNASMLWSKDRHTRPEHPSNGCLWAEVNKETNSGR